MIFITGDTHGEYERFSSQNFPEQKRLTKEDYVIICGDFGIWDDSPSERYWFKWLDEKPFTTLFVDGNHSNYDLLARYPVNEWHGGKVQFIRPSLIHLMRGQVYDIGGHSFFTMGGASCHDIGDGILDPDAPDFAEQYKRLAARRAMFRINHRSWWKEELPSDEEYAIARESLTQHDMEVDYIITHCAPNSIAQLITGSLYQPDALTAFLEEVKEQCKYRYWFFGHYHENAVIAQKHVVLYEQIIELN
jgi:predicted phosphodiesterase